MKDGKTHHFLETFLRGGEAAVDLLTDNDAVRAVPVIGTAIGLLKGLDDMRDRALAAKLERFFREPALQSASAQQKLREGINRDAEEAAKVGEMLFLVLDKVTDLEKPGLLARVFLAYLDGVVSGIEMRRLAHAMDAAFTDDLLALQDWQESAHVSYGTEWKRPLAGPGLTQVVTGRTFQDVASVYYELTDLGRTLHRALWHARHA